MIDEPLRKIEAFCDHDTQSLRVYPDGADTGAPCIEIPLTRDALYAWCYQLMKCADDSTWEHDGDSFMLPGFFGTLTEDV